MPEIALYTHDLDDLHLVRVMLEHGARLVADLKYSKTHYEEISTEDGFIDLRSQTRSFFVLHHSFSRLPLECVLNEVGSTPFYMVMPRNGGPAISFLCGGTSTINDSSIIREGEIHYYPTYWDTDVGENKAAPQAEVIFFETLVDAVKREFTLRRHKNRAFWIGPQALRRIETGAKLVGIDI